MPETGKSLGKAGLPPCGSERFRLSVPMAIRYADLDVQHHLNSVAYFTYMEQARVEYLRNLGLWDGRGADPIGIMVVEATCTYLAPAYLGETVEVAIRLSRIGNKSFDFEYYMTAERGRIATGRTVLVCYDIANQRTLPIPEEWRHALVAFESGVD